MNVTEARTLLRHELRARYGSRPHEDLRRLIGAPPSTLVRLGASGTQYQMEFEVVWDDRPGGAIRVFASIDDGGWRAVAPVSDGVLVAPGASGAL
jgi:hypothetical protein